ncbi:bifunctional arginine dihydrolase/ornithine cyclodeaminase [Anthocerotibacter panamensis]|uniref:bifunctional arginine dihydrolase/ornithine cyclodeaminase n=1 Tax=Anthocerotibacter panamensis TaxID=2857077 RepID=UPI001C406625|nr:TIGR00300 family protein [Anthocerotibacter panamensis]
MTTLNRYLMCAPEHFDIAYVINPWMEGNMHRASPEVAREQWQRLYTLIASQAQVELVQPQPGLPDMPFTANAGLILENKVVLSHFLFPERQGEEQYFEDWFSDHNFIVYKLPAQIPFEGAGDALLDRDQRWLWAGYGHRSALDSHVYLAKWLELEVLSLRLVDERFYHLDTCFCPLSRGYLLYYPLAFDEPSRRLIAQRVPQEKRIIVSEKDAVHFACNAVNIDDLVILNQATAQLREQLQQVGFQVAESALTEFMKAGGAAKCLTLKLNEPRQSLVQTPPVIAQRTIELEGHLLDSNLMSRVMDMIVESGGSFEILEFHAGARPQDLSHAQLLITAPSQERLEEVLTNLIDVGARLPSIEATDCTLEVVRQSGVAPEDFYITTIYNTEVRVQGRWYPVQGQRMDGAIVVDDRAIPPQVHCQLLRDLHVGQKVVCGVDGLRTLLKREGRETEEFTFMGSSISSERRVELIVEQIAWELRRLRDQGGKVVVVGGPVVIHTGGGVHLAQLIREGYVQALLGGNAIAVHDIEQALFGTSLGVDMQRGQPVRGGHRHHLKTINKIRACGGIAQAVAQGYLTSGIFYECVRKQIPFVLAGSIRDDGPLPETQMDLIKAQEQYSRLIQGAQMILMLSSMLHSIGVGNMTPAGVKLVCVDINPAVVTKLADRGSVESTGIVTDVGLFLSLLVRQLEQLG